MRRIIWSLCHLVIWSFFVGSVSASEQFYTKYDVNYTFDLAGQAQIDQKISLTNKQPGVYASAYQITIQGDPPQNISGSDGSGPLKIAVERPSDQTTVINVEFNQQVVGLNNTLTFHLMYTGRPAAHNGQVWEISLPRLVNTDTIEDYVLNLTVPSSFGQPAFISPSPISTSDHKYSFSKDQISRVGIIAAFGNFQTFDFSFSYQLKNPSQLSTIAEVAIPADTGYQRIFYSHITPTPFDVMIDEDGNWLANFKLDPLQNLTVNISGQAHLLAEPSRIQPIPTPLLLQKYLQPTAYWPSSDSQIKALATRLKTPLAIYNYVVQTLKYDSNRARPGVVRKGGISALRSPDSSICTEFTDLFITLARSAGIPAREVNGFAYTTDKKLRPLSLIANIFHAWPQYWDERKQVWVSVDPTWENTTGGIDYFHKLDFNHFAFITRGLSDSSPFISSENVKVDYGTYTDFPPVLPQAKWQLPLSIWPVVINKAQLSVANPSGQAVYRLPLSISAQNITSQYTGPDQLEVLPPFSTRNYDIYLYTKFWPNFQPKKLTLSLGTQVHPYNINDRLFLAWQIILAISAASIITALGWLTIKAWSVYLQKRKGGSSLCR